MALARKGAPAADLAFDRALTAEILSSEQLRVRVLAVTLAVLLVVDEALFWLAHDTIQQFARQPLSAWVPLHIIGPFLAYETIVVLVLR